VNCDTCLFIFLFSRLSQKSQGQTTKFFGHLLKDDLVNPVKMSVRPSVHNQNNAATNQIVVYVKVDEAFTTIRSGFTNAGELYCQLTNRL